MAEFNGISTEIIAVIDSVCTKLQVPAAKLYAVCVKQAVVSGILDSIFSIVFTCLSIKSYFFMKKVINSSKEDSWGDAEYMGMPAILVLLIVGLVFCFFLVCSALCIYEALTAIINPEYKAIEIISNLFKAKS